MEVGLRESCFAESLLKQLHGAKAETVETSLKSRRRCRRVDVPSTIIMRARQTSGHS
ncbi:uncharacterized protein LACBIDRAFT_318538 [Laccaria bicolor S238N-H82]|uniref:Predicted protein n=1 Tax=Laccaria bicolor (strain S238N-H82 / ATCC MYA-4686) TaxID=486041 RepID=B0E2L9_LACBS|nr:uncharacterized protein LACBIDRAFT_318538 [Laccaria bicolor S238N-H82]EDQ98917.1 predicted protein [Laccaria bicolor S238N-H82]|eukprot:XP_001890428.1 predicted protein [Laccaria bicolor S238N-H82]